MKKLVLLLLLAAIHLEAQNQRVQNPANVESHNQRYYDLALNQYLKEHPAMNNLHPVGFKFGFVPPDAQGLWVKDARDCEKFSRRGAVGHLELRSDLEHEKGVLRTISYLFCVGRGVGNTFIVKAIEGSERVIV